MMKGYDGSEACHEGQGARSLPPAASGCVKPSQERANALDNNLEDLMNLLGGN